MLKQHRKITDFYEHVDLADLNNELLTNREKADLNALFHRLEDLNWFIMKLQRESTKISNARALFNGVMKSFSELSNRLSSTSTIVKNTLIEIPTKKFQSS